MAEAAIAVPAIMSATGAGAGAAAGAGGAAAGAGMAGTFGSILSLSSLGMSAFGGLARAEGEAAALEYKAARAEEAAKFGRLKADQTDAYLREELNTTLANIDVVRAAANIDPTSPTTDVIRDEQTRISDRQRRTAVVNARTQADADEAGARYLREAAGHVLTAGRFGAAGTLLRGAAPLTARL